MTRGVRQESGVIVVARYQPFTAEEMAVIDLSALMICLTCHLILQ